MTQSDKDRKAETLRAAFKDRVDKEAHAFHLVEKMVLLDSVDVEFFLNSGRYITISQYNDVTEERAITKLCGYPLCSNQLTQNFCSNKCYKASKYFQSQLSAEPVWMRDKNKSLQLKILDDVEAMEKKFSGYGEEVVMNVQKNDEEKDANDEYEDVSNYHKYDIDDIHENIKFDNDIDSGCIVERFGNVKIDLDIDVSDSDDDSDKSDYDVDKIADHQHRKEKEKRFSTDKSAPESGKYVSDHFKSAKMQMPLSENEGQILKNTNSKDESPNQAESNTSKLYEEKKTKVLFNTSSNPKYSHPQTSSLDEKCKKNNLTKKSICTSEFGAELTNENDGLSANASVFTESSEASEKAKDCVDKIYSVLVEWCSTESRKYLQKSDRDQKNTSDEFKCKSGEESMILPPIDSKSKHAIRGKIVSEKLTKAMFPMLSKLSLTMADISFQLTCLLKTFSFTNINIVLSPSEWNLVAMILLLILAKKSPSLNEPLSPRQKDISSLLSTTVDKEDVDRLLSVFDFESCLETAADDDGKKFDMEELD
ncbi:putative RNA polymerase II subunit B1 CTD phosphatase RPAP2 isoform X2 [Dendronephthya gigantea]|uniref:putative RNA polymerase II subunit B1 CTD phosphatase RPAP2 isoform X2 n=1 Tax=Dendronephthya gigantea TaxID=151771 RepID=UPI00106AE8FA|nr:putative RNA polymerase II subunit B1 CTD phosphatase RPAP2 isoform X2 [Dendronephthya gigantea]